MEPAPLKVGYMRMSKPTVPNRRKLTPAQYKTEYARLEADDRRRQRMALIEAGCLPEHIYSDRGLKSSHTLDHVGVQAWLRDLAPVAPSRHICCASSGLSFGRRPMCLPATRAASTPRLVRTDVDRR